MTDKKTLFNVLYKIAKEFNEKNILWAVGASILLNHYNLIDEINDIDIFVHEDHIEKADALLKKLGNKKEREKVGTYSTKYFYEYVIDHIDIDVMAGFVINHGSGQYNYIFDEKSITAYMHMGEIQVPLTALEDWYVIYNLIPNRQYKVKLIEDYLNKNKVIHPYLLKRALNNHLPKKVEKNIHGLL
ncbi:nucleotidyltransferase family protein [Anaeromicrobium sediminis]|uniref:Nucleotidyltransferase family protein n=1 Tax=Anaeromicrobium sediminis TaxID=1478221 RepID=A0A267MMW8_9FIRM|nr:hypothetical protein [Anaeromicrobium sediminis]PAB60268.1 hypothetical protein CCE28_05040 [Anaeromicrobium sediminis]